MSFKKATEGMGRGLEEESRMPDGSEFHTARAIPYNVWSLFGAGSNTETTRGKCSANTRNVHSRLVFAERRECVGMW